MYNKKPCTCHSLRFECWPHIHQITENIECFSINGQVEFKRSQKNNGCTNFHNYGICFGFMCGIIYSPSENSSKSRTCFEPSTEREIVLLQYLTPHLCFVHTFHCLSIVMFDPSFSRTTFTRTNEQCNVFSLWYNDHYNDIRHKFPDHLFSGCLWKRFHSMCDDFVQLYCHFVVFVWETMFCNTFQTT